MTLLAVKETRQTYLRQEKYTAEPREMMAFCPGCKALQTVWLNDNTLMSTRKFTQVGNHIYHNCGSEKPCRLYYNW